MTRISAIVQFLRKTQGQYSGGFCVEVLYWSTVDADWRRCFRFVQAPAARGSETILLVEDAVPLRQVTREFLKESGYAVLEAGNATEALEAAENRAAEISLLIADVVLPGINGPALAEQLTSRRPGTKVLYISGYTADAMVRNGVLQSEIAFLKKSFTHEALALKVREILDAA